MTTLRQKIGQMLIMGFDGYEITEANPVKNWLCSDGLGGVLLFDHDLKTNTPGKNLLNRQQITRLTQQLREYAAIGTDDLSLFIAIDYEGGAVDRLKHVPDCMVTSNAIELSALSEKKLVQETEKMAATLKSLGFNLNFAPVLDLSLNNQEGIIGKLKRSFSCDPFEVARVARQFVKAFNDEGITCCYKHFPGHGSAVGDSHLGFVDVSQTFEPQETEPYSLLFSQSQAAMVMTAHVINRNLDNSGLPATLSHPILTGLLREQMAYDGVIVSDDLQMKAISDHFSLSDALCMTINAGADMMIFGNQWGQISATLVIDTIENLVQSGKITSNRICEAWERIVRLKQMDSAFA